MTMRPCGRRALVCQEGLEYRAQVLLAVSGTPRPQPLMTELVVLGDVVGGDSDKREQQHRDLPGAVAPAGAVEDDRAGLGVRDRSDDCGAAVGKALEVRTVVERCAELRPGVPRIPEGAVFGAVERQVAGNDASRARRGVGPALIVVAQIDDRPYPVLDERGPTGGGQPSSASLRTTAPQRVRRPSVVGRPPRPRTLKHPFQSRCRRSLNRPVPAWYVNGRRLSPKSR